jgi:hypothetical protein
MTTQYHRSAVVHVAVSVLLLVLVTVSLVRAFVIWSIVEGWAGA